MKNGGFDDVGGEGNTWFGANVGCHRGGIFVSRRTRWSSSGDRCVEDGSKSMVIVTIVVIKIKGLVY